MLMRVCDICKNPGNVQTFFLPYYEETNSTSGWKTNTPTIEFSGKIVPKEFDLCQKCGKEFFKNNIALLVGKNLKDELGFSIFSVKYNDEV